MPRPVFGVLCASPDRLAPEQLMFTIYRRGSPLANFTVYYGDGNAPSGLTKLGAPRRLKTDADYVLTGPPRSISLSWESRSRIVLAAMSEGLVDNVEEWLSGPDQRIPVISAHAQWDAPDSQVP